MKTLCYPRAAMHIGPLFYTLLSLLILAAPALAEPGAPTLWRCPDDYGPTLRPEIEAVAGGVAGQLIGEADINAWLAKATLKGGLEMGALGCLDDAATCPDGGRGVLQALGFEARIDATAAREGVEWVVTLTRVPAGPGAKTAVTGRGLDPRAAVQAAVDKLGGYRGVLKVTVTPPTARIYLGKELLGQGSGEYNVPPGKHQVKAEVEGHQPVIEAVEITPDQPGAVNFDLTPTGGTVRLQYTPSHATVRLGDEILARAPGEIILPPGEHLLVIEADKWITHEVRARVGLGQVTPVKVDLQPVQETFLDRFRAPHPDTQALPLYVRAGFRGLSVLEGDVGVSRGQGEAELELESISERVSQYGLEVAVGWRGDQLIFEPLALAWVSGGGTVLGRGPDGLALDVDNISRVVVKPAWVGLRWPMWRLEPYLLGGVNLVFESMSARPVDETSLVQPADLSRQVFSLGFEAGARWFVTPEWIGHFALTSELMFGERMVLSFIMGGAWAFDLQEGF